MKIRLTEDARAEFDNEFGYLLLRSPTAAESFLEDVEEAKALLQQHPGIGSPLARQVRKLRLNRHRLDLIYRVEGDIIHIYAIAPHKKKPGYWRKRIGRLPPP